MIRILFFLIFTLNLWSQEKWISVTPQDSTHQAFLIPDRREHITKFPCQNCHANQSLKGQNEPQLAHWDLKLNHAAPSIMSCATCHGHLSQKEGGLHTLKGQKLGLEESYLLCSQCHFQQARDWQGGAHGKRLQKWKGERKIQTCTGCHNPHSPAFPKKFPVVKATAHDRK